MVKRLFDLASASALLALSMPLLALAAFLIKLDSAGPVVFRQSRMGRGFKEFKMFKLRTMRAASMGCLYTLGADPRITRIGRWLRRLKIDELPQLWNVVRGEMSMVGPRPVVPELAVEFKEVYKRLLEVRPGLTDPATLKYCDETEMLSRIPEPLEYFKAVVTPDKVRISQAYVLQANAWSDAGVLARTMMAVMFSFWRLPVQALRGRRSRAPALSAPSRRSVHARGWSRALQRR